MTEKRNKGFGERDIRYTVSKDSRTLYAVLLAWPRAALATIAALAPHEELLAVALLGHAEPLDLHWERTSSGVLRVTMPRARLNPNPLCPNPSPNPNPNPNPDLNPNPNPNPDPDPDPVPDPNPNPLTR